MAEPEQLGEQARAYLDAFSAHQRGAPPSVADAAWAGIEAGLGGPGLAEVATETAAQATKGGLLGSIKVFAAVVVIGGGGLIGARVVLAPHPEAAVDTPPRPAVAEPRAEALPQLDPEPGPSAGAAVLTPAPLARPEASTPARAPKSDALAREVALMRKIRDAVHDAEFERALRLLARHRREFPRGVLGEEHDALEVVCACALGRADGQSRLARFRARYPESPQTQAVLTTCNSSDGAESPATRDE